MGDLDRYQYGYDQNSNRLWKANVVGTAAVGNLDEGYAYDNLNRLTQMQRGTLSGGVITGTPVREMDYTLDPTGNWAAYLTKTSGTTDLNQTRSSSPVNEITAISGTPNWASPPTYDATGNMTSFPQPATPSNAYTATYDAWNRMVSISDTGGTVATYQYDGSNRRIVKNTTATSETRHFYYTSQWQDIEERTGTSTSMDKQYVWGVRYIDELICRDDATPERLYACQDANFNVTAITDTSGNIQQRFLYDPYGNSAVLTAAWVSTIDAYEWSTRFTGQYFDSETGLYYYRARYYHLMGGRFINRDPIHERTYALLYNRVPNIDRKPETIVVEPDTDQHYGSVNLYEYAQSNPVVRLDPGGLDDTAQASLPNGWQFIPYFFDIVLAGTGIDPSPCSCPPPKPPANLPSKVFTGSVKIKIKGLGVPLGLVATEGDIVGTFGNHLPTPAQDLPPGYTIQNAWFSFHIKSDTNIRLQVNYPGLGGPYWVRINIMTDAIFYNVVPCPQVKP